MAVEGKTILQTTERTELTGKEGIPFQEGDAERARARGKVERVCGRGLGKRGRLEDHQRGKVDRNWRYHL